MRALAFACLFLSLAGCTGNSGDPVAQEGGGKSVYFATFPGIVEYRPGSAVGKLIVAQQQAQAGLFGIAPDGTIWYAPYGESKLRSYASGTRVKFSYDHLGSVSALAISPDGRIALVDFLGHAIEEFRRDIRGPVARYKVPGRGTIAYDDRGSLWFASGEHLMRFDRGRTEAIRTRDAVETLKAGPGGRVYLAGSTGVTVIDRTGRMLEHVAIPFPRGSDLFVDARARLYVIHHAPCEAAGDFVAVYEPGKTTALRRAGAYAGIASIGFDNRDRVYLSVNSCEWSADLLLPWSPQPHIEIYQAGLGTLIASPRGRQGNFRLGPPSI